MKKHSYPEKNTQEENIMLHEWQEEWIQSSVQHK